MIFVELVNGDWGRSPNRVKAKKRPAIQPLIGVLAVRPDVMKEHLHVPVDGASFAPMSQFAALIDDALALGERLDALIAMEVADVDRPGGVP